MIDRLKGKIIEREPTKIVLYSGGIGFEICVPLSVSQEIPEEGELFIHPVFKEKEIKLYGFRKKGEREIFKKIISVPRVGETAALNLLSRYSPEEIEESIKEERIEILASTPGIGKKKALKIIFELKGALGTPEEKNKKYKDAVKALLSLGLTQKEAKERIERIKNKKDMSLADIIKEALKNE